MRGERGGAEGMGVSLSSVSEGGGCGRERRGMGGGVGEGEVDLVRSRMASSIEMRGVTVLYKYILEPWLLGMPWNPA